MMAVMKSAICIAAGLIGAQHARADEAGQYKAALNGYNEVVAVSTPATGQVSATVADDKTSINIVLNYSKLQGSSPVAGLFFGRRGVTGAPLAFVCGGGGKPVCPVPDGEVSVTIAAADILATPTQGIKAADMAALIDAIDNGAVYLNVVTGSFTGGEIRGQLMRGNQAGNAGDSQGPPADNPGKGHEK